MSKVRPRSTPRSRSAALTLKRSAAAPQRRLRRSAALRRAILERAFRGELVPQDPSDEPASALLERIAAERAMGSPRRVSRRGAQT